MFDFKFVESLPEDPLLAAKEICDKFFEFDKGVSRGFNSPVDSHEDYTHFFEALKASLEYTDLNFPAPEMGLERHANIRMITDFFTGIHGIIHHKFLALKYKPKFAIKFGQTFVYEFSDEDYTRVQEIINELRDLISKSKTFEEDFKARLLKRVEKLQSELHKKMSDLDRFWGFIGDAGVALGKFGQDVKPLTDRIQEMVRIVWRTQAKSEGVPGTPALPFTDNNQLED